MSTWDSPAKASEYLGRIGASGPRLAGEAALVEMLPVSVSSVLDLGCGDGRLAALVLGARPSVDRVVAVDKSPPMLDAARMRFRDDVRVEVREWDLSVSIASLGSFDLVVSGFAIHHLEDDRKRELFDEVACQLRPGTRTEKSSDMSSNPCGVCAAAKGRSEVEATAVT